MFYCVDKNFNCHSHAFCHAMYSYLYLYDAGFEVVRITGVSASKILKMLQSISTYSNPLSQTMLINS